MKHIYAFENNLEYEKYKHIAADLMERLTEYQKVLERNYSLTSMPKAIVWTTEELATSVFSTVAIPAYTSKDIIYITPDLDAWRKLFMEQLDGLDIPQVQHFFENYSENMLFTILAHELTHHSDLFLDEFADEREDSIWFEEGMCDYLARKTCLNKSEFLEIALIESELVEAFQDKYGDRTLDEFGIGSYQGCLSRIMFDYWRSFLTVKFLVEEVASNNIMKIFEQYHNWDKEGRKVPLTTYFGIDSLNMKPIIDNIRITR
ncbi:hypothetical protein ACFSTA_17270 [Ornithinibacillus salinisoli]|uniref:Elongation factor Tu n=1 Tax=Ornithinibacillus salinisoli TaxID=1848459 RepID=A0ABW4W0V5_9BACI